MNYYKSSDIRALEQWLGEDRPLAFACREYEQRLNRTDRKSIVQAVRDNIDHVCRNQLEGYADIVY